MGTSQVLEPQSTTWVEKDWELLPCQNLNEGCLRTLRNSRTGELVD